MPILADQDASQTALPVWRVRNSTKEALYASLPATQARFARETRFDASAGKVLLLPDNEGRLAGALLGLGDGEEPFIEAALASALPGGIWRLAGEMPYAPELALLGFALGAYRFSRYRKKETADNEPHLIAPPETDAAKVALIAKAIFQVRDLINIPAEDCGPAELAQAVREAAKAHGAQVSVTEGDALLADNYPLIHAVGRASHRPPALIDLRWSGVPSGPRVTLVGKGICFDTGGLNLKPENAMALMKKDMGGAANALGLSLMIMQAKLPVKLRLLIAAADNAVAGNAFRPGDVFTSRKGLTVEIGNTDAEGRLVLADALHEADGESPDLLFSFATLTGAARVAMGPDVVPFYTKNDALAEKLMTHSVAQADPVWRLPLWKPYARWLDSKVADINHIASKPFAGSIVAALFLERFVANAKAYFHFDMYAWNTESRPGRPIGGEAQTIRAIFAFLKEQAGRP